jgi:23S rRNA pseudouridine2605 synthase
VVGRDRISVDGRRIGRPRRPRYYVVYKPRGVVTTTRDERARKTVLDLLPARGRLFPVGRLDAQSEGLLLLTNDGELGQLLLHPSFGIPRTYRVSVDGRVRAESLRRLTEGIMLGSRKHAVQSAWLLQQSEKRSVLGLELVEGRRHQIRKMMATLGHPVRRLVRTGFGPLTLKGLRPGEWRPPTDVERRALQRLVTNAHEKAAERHLRQ